MTCSIEEESGSFFLLNMGYIFCYMALLINTGKLIAVGKEFKKPKGQYHAECDS